eukprot:7822729-Pyramimonas_sp.AAC.1
MAKRRVACKRGLVLEMASEHVPFHRHRLSCVYPGSDATSSHVAKVHNRARRHAARLPCADGKIRLQRRAAIGQMRAEHGGLVVQNLFAAFFNEKIHKKWQQRFPFGCLEG